MKDEITDIIWDFARSVSKTTLNPHLTYAASIERNNQLAAKAVNDIIAITKQHDPQQHTAKVARV